MSNDVRARYVSSMPGQVGAVFFELWEEVVWLHGVWDIFVELFGAEQKRVDLLNDTAPAFFNVVSRTMQRDVFLGVARITDPASSGKGGSRTNVSLWKLLEEVKAAGDTAYAAKLEPQLNNLVQHCAPIRDVRNRLLAHADLATAQGVHPNPIPGVTRNDMERALELVRSFMNEVENHYRQSVTAYQKSVSAGAVEPLIRSLEEAQALKTQADN